jgi:hypothetical protein
MARVYFNKEKNYWFVNELTDYYLFKAVDYKTNQESEHILSWSRNFDNLPEKVDRAYDVEIDGQKYYFLFEYNDKEWIVISKDKYELERLLRDKDLFFVGDSIEIVE